jgi:hypothetical protein
MALIYRPYGFTVKLPAPTSTGSCSIVYFSMTFFRQHSFAAAIVALLCGTLLTRPAWPQSTSVAEKASPSASVVVLPVALYNAQANLQEASDTARATLSTQVLTGKLRELLGSQLVSGSAVARAAASDKAAATTGHQPCNVIVACARQVANSLKAPWVVIAKVSKTSNLIWLFTGQLIHAPTGEIVLDDSTELKGEPEAMVRAGSRIFAERVARTVRRGGLVTNFPT